MTSLLDLKLMAVLAGLVFATQHKRSMLPAAILSMSLASTVHAAPAPCSMVNDLTPPRSTGYTEQVTAERYWRFEIETDYCWREGQDFMILVTENLPRTWQRTFKGFVVQVRSPFYLGHKLVGSFQVEPPPGKDWTYKYIYHCGNNGSAMHKNDQPKRHATLFWYADQGHRYNYVLISGVVLIDGRRYMKMREVQVLVCPPRPPRAYITPSTNVTNSTDFNITTVPFTSVPTALPTPVEKCRGNDSADGLQSRPGYTIHYSALHGPATGKEAKEQCARDGATLATIKNEAEYSHLLELANGNRLWLGFEGAENLSMITWADGGLVNDFVEESSILKWGVVHRKRCGYLRRQTRFATTFCFHTTLRYICQWKCPNEAQCPEGYFPSTGIRSRPDSFMCYSSLQEESTFKQAKENCATNGSSLVTIKHREEYEHLMAIPQNGLWVGFIGANNLSAIVWFDGGFVKNTVEDITEIKWYSIDEKECGYFDKEVGKVATVACHNTFHYICHLQCPINGKCFVIRPTPTLGTPAIENVPSSTTRRIATSGTDIWLL